MFEGEGVAGSPLLPFKANLGQTESIGEKEDYSGLLYSALDRSRFSSLWVPTENRILLLSNMMKCVVALAPG